MELWSNNSTNDDQKKPHAICVTFPAQGHVIPMMQLAKLLHYRGFYITFVNTEFNHKRLVRAKGGTSEWVHSFPDFKFETMSDGLPPSDRDATQDPPTLCCSLRRNCLIAFRDLLDRVRSDKEVPPITCIVADGLMSCAIRAAQEIGVPEVQFWTASACGFMCYLHFPDLLRRGIIPFKDANYEHDGTLDKPVDWIPGMKNMRLRDLPSFIRMTDVDDILFNFVNDEVQNCLKAPTIIVNTFDSLEHQVLEAIKPIFPNIYTIGPLSLIVQKYIPESPLKSFRPSLWKDDTKCLEWLAQKEPKSVVYVNYGCITVMTRKNLEEFAWGLANSKHSFLWAIRPDLVMGQSDGSLPMEFMVETQDRGLVVSWCPQDEVLAHPAIGVFLTHCGWNSLLESVCEAGVPLICWPFFAEQQTNCRYACLDDEWGIGVEVNNEVKREEIEDLVREMMDEPKGITRRKRAQELMHRRKRPPSVGAVKINVDAGRVREQGTCLGIVCRQSDGRIVVAATYNLVEKWAIVVAEAKAALLGLQVAHTYGYTNVILETDNLAVFNALNNYIRGPSLLDLVIEDIQDFSSVFSKVSWSFVRRSGNSVAHEVAHVLPWEVGVRFWDVSIPMSVTSAIAYDMSMMNES